MEYLDQNKSEFFVGSLAKDRAKKNGPSSPAINNYCTTQKNTVTVKNNYIYYIYIYTSLYIFQKEARIIAKLNTHLGITDFEYIIRTLIYRAIVEKSIDDQYSYILVVIYIYCTGRLTSLQNTMKKAFKFLLLQLSNPSLHSQTNIGINIYT